MMKKSNTIHKNKEYIGFYASYLCGETTCKNDCEVCSQIFKEVKK
jgi:hypothetical protein